MTDETEVLVVGAGPTGLTLAAGLLSRGIRVRLIDKAERESPHSKAITLWPRALEAFEALGIGEQLYERGVKLKATSYYTGGGLLGRVPIRALKDTRFAVPLSLPQTTTEELLRDVIRKAGGKIEYGRALTTLEQDEDGAVAGLDDGTTVRAAFVVGCDGAHSTVRDLTGVTFDGAPYAATFVLVDGVYSTDYVHDESYYVMGKTGVMVVVGLPDGLYRVFASAPPGTEVDDVEALVAKIAAQNSPKRLSLVEAAGSGSFQIHRRLADRMRIGRVLLAGDAAHIHSPAGGLGMNTGVQDADALAWRLAGILRGPLPQSELDAWQTERLFVAKAVIAETDQQTRMWMMKGWRRFVRDVVLKAGVVTGTLARVLPRRVAQLDMVVPATGPAAGKLRPGARLPDLPMADGRRTRDLLSGGGHVLLVFGPRTGPALSALDIRPLPDRDRLQVVAVTSGPMGSDGVSAVVSDPGERLRRGLGAPAGAVCLVRPDGVIAAATVVSDPAGISDLRSRVSALTAPGATAAQGRQRQGETR